LTLVAPLTDFSKELAIALVSCPQASGADGLRRWVPLMRSPEQHQIAGLEKAALDAGAVSRPGWELFNDG